MKTLIILRIYEFYSLHKKEEGHDTKKIVENFYTLLNFMISDWSVVHQKNSLADEQKKLMKAIEMMLFYGEGITKIISGHKKEFVELNNKFAQLQEKFDQVF